MNNPYIYIYIYISIYIIYIIYIYIYILYIHWSINWSITYPEKHYSNFRKSARSTAVRRAEAWATSWRSGSPDLGEAGYPKDFLNLIKMVRWLDWIYSVLTWFDLIDGLVDLIDLMDCWWFCRLVAWSLGRLILNARCLFGCNAFLEKTRGSINQLLTFSCTSRPCRSGGNHQIATEAQIDTHVQKATNRHSEIPRKKSKRIGFFQTFAAQMAQNPKKMSQKLVRLGHTFFRMGDLTVTLWLLLSRVSWWLNQIWDICGVRPGPFIPGSAGQAAINCRRLRIWSGSRPHGPQTERNACPMILNIFASTSFRDIWSRRFYIIFYWSYIDLSRSWTASSDVKLAVGVPILWGSSFIWATQHCEGNSELWDFSVFDMSGL